MNQKTDVPIEKQEFARGFLPFVFLLTVIALGVIISYQLPAERSSRFIMNRAEYRGFTIFPWVIAGGQTILNSLSAFGGNELEYPPSSVRLSLLAGLLVGFIVCPTIYLFRWRDRRLGKQASLRNQVMSISGLMYGACAVMTLVIVAAIIPFGIIQEYVHGSLKSAQEVQSNKDDLINTIDQIVVDMKQFRILPKSMGGGEGSCDGYALPSQLSRTSHGVFSASVVKDSATIMAQSLLSPSSKIIVSLSSSVLVRAYGPNPFPAGGRWDWRYEGEFR